MTFRWYTDAGRHTLQRYSAAGRAPQFTYAVTRGSRTEVTFARRYRESLSTQTVLEAASLFDILADAMRQHIDIEKIYHIMQQHQEPSC